MLDILYKYLQIISYNNDIDWQATLNILNVFEIKTDLYISGLIVKYYTPTDHLLGLWPVIAMIRWVNWQF